MSSLTDAKPKNWLKIDEYLWQLRQESTREDYEFNTHNMQKYISGPVKIKIMMLMIQNDLDTGSKIIYPNSMEVRFFFQKNTVKNFGDTIAQYQAWHQYVTDKRQVEVSELEFPQTP